MSSRDGKPGGRPGEAPPPRTIREQQEALAARENSVPGRPRSIREQQEALASRTGAGRTTREAAMNRTNSGRSNETPVRGTNAGRSNEGGGGVSNPGRAPAGSQQDRRARSATLPQPPVGRPATLEGDQETVVHDAASTRTQAQLPSLPDAQFDDHAFETRLADYQRDPRGVDGKRLVAGRYRLQKSIGEGSMGRIFLAEQVSVGRRVALKIINRELSATYDTIARFQQEARLLAAVDNEHIVGIYDIGETETGDPFIAMEYVDGPSLAQIIREEAPLDPTRTVRILLQVASALATVHDAGVVHRDLKPANIVIVKRGTGGEMVKILDFGLAKVLSDREASGRLTRTGAIVGTPEYMSPEQVTGVGVDHRADIYGFGCSAYEMLSGNPPFTGAEVSTLYKHMHEPIPPLAQVRPGVPGPLAAVVDRCLAKNPDDRYASAQEVHAALLEAADLIGMPRGDLRVPGRSIDVVIDRPIPRPALASLPPPARHAKELALFVVIALVVGLIGGVLIDRAIGGNDDRPEPQAARLAAPAATHGVLLVTTVPPGADVRVDGDAGGPSPRVVRNLAPGNHTVHVAGRGWQGKDETVAIVAGELHELTVSLARPIYTMRIESSPPGATVTVDGKEVGVTPLDTPITESEFHAFSFQRDGYRDRDYFLAADAKEPRLAVTLAPVLLHAGSLTIDSEATGRVFIDGVDTGEWTPTGELQLTPGKHTIELVDNMNVRRKQVVTVVEGQIINVDVPAK